MGVLPFFAILVIPDARKCLMIAAPFAALWLFRWLYQNTDAIIHRVFPHWEWEKNMGWFNLRAHRKAEAFLRGLRYLVQAALAAALYGIIWSAAGISDLWSDPNQLVQNVQKISVLLVSLGVWAVYLGCDLIPKLRREHDDEELQKFRAENKHLDQEKAPSSRLGSGPLLKKSPSIRSKARRN